MIVRMNATRRGSAGRCISMGRCKGCQRRRLRGDVRDRRMEHLVFVQEGHHVVAWQASCRLGSASPRLRKVEVWAVMGQGEGGRGGSGARERRAGEEGQELRAKLCGLGVRPTFVRRDHAEAVLGAVAHLHIQVEVAAPGHGLEPTNEIDGVSRRRKPTEDADGVKPTAHRCCPRERSIFMSSSYETQTRSAGQHYSERLTALSRTGS